MITQSDVSKNYSYIRRRCSPGVNCSSARSRRLYPISLNLNIMLDLDLICFIWRNKKRGSAKLPLRMYKGSRSLSVFVWAERPRIPPISSTIVATRYLPSIHEALSLKSSQDWRVMRHTDFPLICEVKSSEIPLQESAVRRRLSLVKTFSFVSKATLAFFSSFSMTTRAWSNNLAYSCVSARAAECSARAFLTSRLRRSFSL
mmetsp:Transcript_5991/g.12007  ORF Transcript_5991/g.12007 Transcript_5991/m.12007 type:complete len:202 (+) Transcript_5991:477-1082(+)